MTHQMNQPEEQLSAALRELSTHSWQSASPELGLALKDAFRRHHKRRRQVFRMRIALGCLCVAALACLFLLKRPPASDNSARATVLQTIPPQEITSPAETNLSAVRPPALLKRQTPGRNTSADSRGFWALPSFDLIPSGDQLRVVRLQMRGEDLRLVGAPVAEAMVRHRVTADFVVGQDGTPYAVRLVQANF